MRKRLIPQRRIESLTERDLGNSVNIHTDEEKSKNYLILDAALWDMEIEPAFEFGNKYCCLFATKGAEDELNDVAPYLFEYEQSDELSKWVQYKEAKDKRAFIWYQASH